MLIKINNIEKLTVDDSVIDLTDPFLFTQIENNSQISEHINGKIFQINHIFLDNALNIEVR